MEEMQIKLVKGAMRGSKKALEALIQLKSRDILYLSLRFTNKNDYEDAAQEAFYNIAKDIKKLREAEYFDTWMYSTIRNACRNYLKKKAKFEHEILSNQEDEHFMNAVEENIEFLPVEFAEEAELRGILMETLDELPENYKETIILRHLKEMSYQEIAETLNISLKSVNNNLTRGRMKLKAILENRTGRVLEANSLAIGTLPILTRALRLDRIEAIRPEIIADFMNKARIGLAGGHMTSIIAKIAKKIAGSTTKSVAAGIGTVTAVGVGIGSLYMAQTTPAVLPETITITVESTTVPVASTQEILIDTIVDMIGSTAAKQLQGFNEGAITPGKWEHFLQEVGADYEGSINLQDDYEYTMYVLEKQDKQLILFDQKNLATGSIRIKYQFGNIKELPLMIEVVRMF